MSPLDKCSLNTAYGPFSYHYSPVSTIIPYLPEKVKVFLRIVYFFRDCRQFGLLMMEVMGISEARLVQCEQKDVVMSAPSVPDRSLDSSKSFSLGYCPLPLKEEFKNIFA